MSTSWLDSLDDVDRAQADRLLADLERLGAPDPVDWLRAEFEDDQPQFTRFLLLRHLWTETIDPWRDDPIWIDNLIREAEANPNGPFADAGLALRRLLNAGANRRDIGTIARFVAYESVFSVVHTLDEGSDPEHEGQLPGWALIERDALGEPTGRAIRALHEDLPTLDPSGREGRPT